MVDVDPGTGQVKVRRFIAVDDCGPRINPMIVEGQIHGGLADGIGMALMQVIAFDEDGNCLGGSFMDYLLPTSMECPSWELGETVTPSPHHPLGCKGVGESATVGSPAAVVNAVMDASTPFGVRHADMPLTPAQVWLAIQGRPARTDLAIDVTPRDEPAPRCTSGPRRCSAERVAVRARPRGAGRAADVGQARRRGARARPTARWRDSSAATCAESTVRAQSLALLDSGERCCCGSPPAEEEPGRVDRPGKVTVHNPCLSGGTLEIFLEPVVPSPLVVVHGDTPIARALLALAGRLGYDAVCRRGRDAWTGQPPSWSPPTAATRPGARGRPGRGRALRGLVASRQRGEAVLARSTSMPDDRPGCARRPGSTSAPARRRRWRCRSWPRSCRATRAGLDPAAPRAPAAATRSTRCAACGAP